MDGLLDASVAELAARVRSRAVSVLDLVDAHIARIEAVNPSITAVVATRFSEARQEALAVEARLTNAPPDAPLPPLLGVPFTAQEAVGLSGMPMTGGGVYRWDASAEMDSTAIARLRVAGAIPLAVTNLPESGVWLETTNLLYGRTANPWDRQHTAGGACGGEAALIAAGGSPFGIGSGLLSAVTIPAAFCGVAGYQPSNEWAPRAEAWTASHLGCGVMARRCSDLHTLAAALLGRDFTSAPDDLLGRKVFILPTLPGVRVARSISASLERAAASLIARGAEVVALPEELVMSQAGWSAMLADRLPENMTELLSDGRSVPVLREALRFPLGRANHTSSALIVTMMETIRRTMPTRQAELLSSALTVRANLEALLGEDGVILHPAYSRPAPRHRGTLITPFDIQLSSHFSVMGMPSAIVPVGFTIRGLPLAVQLTAARQQDALALDAAAHLEAEFGGWVRAQPT